MFVETTHTRPQITGEEMRAFMHQGWGELGERVAETWHEYNETYFGGELKPTPITLVNTSPFGHWLGLTSGLPSTCRIHLIQLTWPNGSEDEDHKPVLVADRGVLLHEMIHQRLCECGRLSKHGGQPWCEEISRINEQITGKPLFIAPDEIIKVKDENGKRRSQRRRRVSDTGQVSLSQGQIAQWPHSVGIGLGPLWKE